MAAGPASPRPNLVPRRGAARGRGERPHGARDGAAPRRPAGPHRARRRQVRPPARPAGTTVRPGGFPSGGPAAVEPRERRLPPAGRAGGRGGGVRPCREPVPSSAAVGEPARRAALPVPYCAPAPAGRPRSRERYSRPGKRVQPRGAGLPRALPAARPGLRRRAGRGCSRRVDWRAPVALPARQRQPRRASPPCNAGLPSVSFGPGRCEKSHRPCG